MRKVVKGMSQEPLMNDDAVVVMFLSLVEEDGMEINITFYVKGAIISGTLISANAYYEGVIQSFKEKKDETFSRIMTKKFSDLKAEYLKQKQESDNSDSKDESKNAATFIHLKNAKILGRNNEITASSKWWRGRIATLDAISFN